MRLWQRQEVQALLLHRARRTMTSWFLIFVLWAGGHDATVIRFPMTSVTACNDARTGIKFPPAPASVNATGGGASSNGGVMAVFCAASDSQVVTDFPVPVP